jgi:hypothetical protein
MPISSSTRRLALTLTLVLSLVAFAAALLLGPSQTLAKAHVSTCSSAHPKTKCTGHACAHMGKGRHTSKCAKHHKKKAKPPAQVAARCEDGSTPARAGDGSFSCEDGSLPACANGAIPTPSRNGRSLLCPIIVEEEAEAGETECEDGPGTCSAGVTPGVAAGSPTAAGAPSEEQVCEGAAGEGSSAPCPVES